MKNNEDGTVDLAVRVVCSAGTYVRMLAAAPGERLGVGAHLAELRRTQVGDFQISDARSLEQLKANADEATLATVLLPTDAALSGMPFVHLTAADLRRALNGMAVGIGLYREVRWLDFQEDEAGQLMAVGSYEAATGLLHPRVVIGGENRA